ncbi:MAG: 3-deoxy-D-manno-octulosonic acid transferase [Candidatus Protochlamydia sp.]|nr:3-deoxy-D-manno-octulosonic acid transferase [Candidatus Protochlamydia sp.]
MNRILIICYEICLWALAILAAPKMLYHLYKHKKYLGSLGPRLGLNYPIFEKSHHPLIWIHAVSMGEAKAVVSLARELKFHYPNARLVVSSITETGHAEVQRSFPFADYRVYLPFDFSFIVRRIMQQASPDVVILCESDFWFNFLRYAKKEGALLALVNGKISSRSKNRFRAAPFFSKPLFNLFEVLCIQNEFYAKRFLQAGAPSMKMEVTGNLKLDDEYPQLCPEETAEWRKKLGIGPDQLVLTIGSSHHPEEQLFLTHLKDIWKKYPELKVLIVPRHPERFKEVESLLENEDLSWISFTDINCRTGKEQVILVDAMGMLRMCYQLSDIALVAGSFTSKVGGHNILEPCWYGKPVLFGPFMHTQLELVDYILNANAALQVSMETLKDQIELLVTDAYLRSTMGQNGLELIQSLKGSTQRTLLAIEHLFEKDCFQRCM